MPHWADFQQHLQCNLRVECASGEDEAQCPYTTDDCGPGRISIDGVCYVYVVPEELTTTADLATRDWLVWKQKKSGFV